MYISPERDALPPRPRRGRAFLALALLLFGGSLFLALRPDLLQQQTARLFPSATPSATPTPGAADLAATATVALGRGAAAEAAALVHTAVAQDPASAAARSALAAALIRARRYQAAAREAREALRLDPGDVAAYVHLATALDWLGQSAAAVEAAQAALDLEPEDGRALAALAEAQASSGRWEEADRLAREAVAILPQDAVALRALGMAREIQADWDGALEQYRRAAELDRGWAEPLLDQGRIARLRRDPAAARAAFEAAMARDPQDPAGPDGLGLVAYDAADLDEAARWFDKAMALAPDFAAAHGHRGWVHVARGEWAPAAQRFRRALDLGSASVDFRSNEALALAYAGRCQEARPLLLALQAEAPAQAGLLRGGLEACP